MSQRFALTLASALLFGAAAAASAQTPAVAPEAESAAVATAQSATPPAQATEPALPAPARAPRARTERRATDEERTRPAPGGVPQPSKNVNIRIDATVIESRGDQVIGKRAISATIVDGENGSVRSRVFVPTQATTPGSPVVRVENQVTQLNMDVRARLRDDNRVQVWLTLEAQGGSFSLGEGEKAQDAGIRQTVSVLLEPGKPLVVAQSADAVGERRLALEVKATVLR